MTFGASVALIALGAILAFAVHAQLGGLDIHTVGWILMACGLLGVILGMVVYGRRRGALSSTSRRTIDDGMGPTRHEIVEQDIR